MYLTGHPITRYRNELDKITSKNIKELLATGNELGPQKSWQARDESKTILVAGLLDQIRLRNSPKGRIAFLSLDDNTGRMDIAVFAKDYAKFDHVLSKDAILIIKGSLVWDEYTGRVRVRADHVWSFDDYLKQFGALLNIKIKANSSSPSWVQELHQLLLPFKDGNCPIRLVYENNSVETGVEFPEHWNISLDEKLLQRLSKVSEVLNTSVVYKKPSINA